MPFPIQKFFGLPLNRLLTCLPQSIMCTLPCFHRWPVICPILHELENWQYNKDISDIIPLDLRFSPMSQKFSLLTMNAL